VDKIHKWAHRLGLGGRTGIDVPGEDESVIPSEAWKQRRFKERWYPGDTISVAIGQGYVTTTPVALARMISTIANGGTLVTPHVVRAIDQGAGWEPVPQSQYRLRPTPSIPTCSPPCGMGCCSRSKPGPRAARASKAYEIAGKTGTAQVISLDAAKAACRPHHPGSAPPWLVCVFCAEGESLRWPVWCLSNTVASSGAATPIVRHVMDTYFAKKEGRPATQACPLPGHDADHTATPGVTVRRRNCCPLRERRTGDRGPAGRPASGLVAARRRPHPDRWWGWPPFTASRGVSRPTSLAPSSGNSCMPCPWGSRHSPCVCSSTTAPWRNVPLCSMSPVDCRTDRRLVFRQSSAKGSQRWIDLGVGSLQPSEFARIGVALVLAMWYGDGRRNGRSLPDLAWGARRHGIARVTDLSPA
jgi:hypothetical protein